MKIQAIFCDIDGTIIDHAHGSVVPESTLSAFEALHRKGVKIFIATGRIPNMLQQVKTLFPFDGYVTLNGQYVLDGNGGVIHKRAHENETIYRLMEVQRTDPFPCLIIEEEESFGVRNEPEIERQFGWLQLPVPEPYDISRLPEHPVLQFLAYMPWEQRSRMDSIPNIQPTCAGGDILDVMPAGGGKEKGIAAACEYYGFSRENVMVFGDGKNDASMLSWAGVGVAMGNAVEEARTAADYITTPVWEDGIYNALKHFEVL